MSCGIGDRRMAARDHGRHHYEERRAAIIVAAGSLFRTQGYQGTTFREVADAVGTERASLYYYFADKEDLFDAVVSQRVLDNLAMVERIGKSDLPPPDKLRLLVTELMRSFAEHYPILYVYLQQNMRHVAPKRQTWAASMRQVNRRFEKAVTDIVEQGIADGSFETKGRAWVTAYGVMGMVSWTHRWFNPTVSEIDADEIAEAYAHILISGLSAKQAEDVTTESE